MKPRFLIAALALAYASHSSTTFAQAFLSDPRLTEGHGIKTGNFELHPSIAAEGGYDSNYFQTSGVQGTEPNLRTTGPGPRQLTVTEPVIDAYRLRITPAFSILTRGSRTGYYGGGPAPTLTLSANANASYNALFATNSADSDRVTNQDDVGVGAGVGLGILPGRTFSGDVSANYNRIIEASNDPDLRNAYKRDNVRGGGGVTWAPGGGLFSVRVGYLANYTHFEAAGFDNLDNIRHSLQLGSTWKFLPRTALLYRGSINWLEYTNTKPATLSNGESATSEVGLNGLISNYFGVLGMIGWGSTFYSSSAGNEQNFDSVIGQAQLTWYPNPQNRVPVAGIQPAGLSSVALGYTRDFGPSYLGTFFQRDRGYLNMAYFFAERFVLSLAGGLSHITRPPTVFASGNTQAPQDEENRVDAVLFAEYRIGGTVGINATFRYDAELEHRVYQINEVAAGMPAAGDDLKFNRYQAYLGVRWFL